MGVGQHGQVWVRINYETEFKLYQKIEIIELNSTLRKCPERFSTTDLVKVTKIDYHRRVKKRMREKILKSIPGTIFLFQNKIHINDGF